MPEWVPLLEVAKEWGVPPWEIEEEAPAVWLERWRVLREETVIQQQRETKKTKPVQNAQVGITDG